MKKIFMVLLGACCAFLVACGGGGDSGAGSTEPPAQTFSATGTWSAMSAGGIYNITLDETAGTLSYLRPDEKTGSTNNTTLSGMTRGADGAYMFNTGFTVGGQSLQIALYRIDNNTLAGQILSSLNGSIKLAPVVASRSVVQDFSQISGDFNYSWIECDYSLASHLCEWGGQARLQGYRASLNIANSTITECNDGSIRISDCAPGNSASTTLTSVGNGVYALDGAPGFSIQAFPVGGENMSFLHFRAASPLTADTTYIGNGLLTHETAMTPAMLNGTWRAASADGRIGNVTINDTTMTVNMAGLAQSTGSINYNAPWNGLAEATIGGNGIPYYLAGNSKLLFVSGDLGFYILHRE